MHVLNQELKHANQKTTISSLYTTPSNNKVGDLAYVHISDQLGVSQHIRLQQKLTNVVNKG